MKSFSHQSSEVEFLPEFYSDLLQRLVSSTQKTNSPYLQKALATAKKYDTNIQFINTVLQDKALSTQEKVKQIEARLKMPLQEYTDQVMAECVVLSGEMITNSGKLKAQGPQMAYFDYRSTDFSKQIPGDIFSPEKFSRHAATLGGQERLFNVLYPTTLYPTLKDQKKAQEKADKSIALAQKVLAKYKDKPIVFSELDKKDFQALKAGFDALRERTINLNNYLISVKGQKDPQIENQKILLEKLHAVMSHHLNKESAKKYEAEYRAVASQPGGIERQRNTYKELEKNNMEVDIYLGYLSNVQAALGKGKYLIAKARIDTMLNNIPNILKNPKPDSLQRLTGWLELVRNSPEGNRYFNNPETGQQVKAKFYENYLAVHIEALKKQEPQEALKALNKLKMDTDVKKYLDANPKENAKLLDITAQLMGKSMERRLSGDFTRKTNSPPVPPRQAKPSSAQFFRAMPPTQGKRRADFLKHTSREISSNSPKKPGK